MNTNHIIFIFLFACMLVGLALPGRVLALDIVYQCQNHYSDQPCENLDTIIIYNTWPEPKPVQQTYPEPDPYEPEESPIVEHDLQRIADALEVIALEKAKRTLRDNIRMEVRDSVDEKYNQLISEYYEH